jgi:hypothetical protein
MRQGASVQVKQATFQQIAANAYGGASTTFPMRSDPLSAISSINFEMTVIR